MGHVKGEKHEEDRGHEDYAYQLRHGQPSKYSTGQQDVLTSADVLSDVPTEQEQQALTPHSQLHQRTQFQFSRQRTDRINSHRVVWAQEPPVGQNQQVQVYEKPKSRTRVSGQDFMSLDLGGRELKDQGGHNPEQRCQKGETRNQARKASKDKHKEKSDKKRQEATAPEKNVRHRQSALTVQEIEHVYSPQLEFSDALKQAQRQNQNEKNAEAACFCVFISVAVIILLLSVYHLVCYLTAYVHTLFTSW